MSQVTLAVSTLKSMNLTPKDLGPKKPTFFTSDWLKFTMFTVVVGIFSGSSSSTYTANIKARMLGKSQNWIEDQQKRNDIDKAYREEVKKLPFWSQPNGLRIKSMTQLGILLALTSVLVAYGIDWYERSDKLEMLVDMTKQALHLALNEAMDSGRFDIK